MRLVSSLDDLTETSSCSFFMLIFYSQMTYKRYWLQRAMFENRLQNELALLSRNLSSHIEVTVFFFTIITQSI